MQKEQDPGHPGDRRRTVCAVNVAVRRDAPQLGGGATQGPAAAHGARAPPRPCPRGRGADEAGAPEGREGVGRRGGCWGRSRRRACEGLAVLRDACGDLMERGGGNGWTPQLRRGRQHSAGHAPTKDFVGDLYVPRGMPLVGLASVLENCARCSDVPNMGRSLAAETVRQRR